MLQGRPIPQINAKDLARPGARIGAKKSDPTQPAVSADHITPMAKLVYLPRFKDLNADNAYIIINSPLNLQWLSWSVNQSKKSRSVADVAGLDPAWVETQVALEKVVEAQLIKAIRLLVESQK